MAHRERKTWATCEPEHMPWYITCAAEGNSLIACLSWDSQSVQK